VEGKAQEPTICIVCQINTVHIFPSHFLTMHFNIDVPSVLRCSKWSLTFTFTHQTSTCVADLPPTCHMTGPTHCPWFCDLIYIWWGMQIRKVLNSFTYTSILGLSFVTTHNTTQSFRNCFLLQVNLFKFTWRRKQFPKHSAMYVVTNGKDLINMCDRIDIKPSSKIYIIHWRSYSLCRFLVSCYLGLSTFLSILFSNTLSVCCSLNVRDQVNTHTKQQAKLYFRLTK